MTLEKPNKKRCPHCGRRYTRWNQATYGYRRCMKCYPKNPPREDDFFEQTKPAFLLDIFLDWFL